ncbi:MAG: hypothetical protein ACE5NG_09325 [bacterium]
MGQKQRIETLKQIGIGRLFFANHTQSGGFTKWLPFPNFPIDYRSIFANEIIVEADADTKTNQRLIQQIANALRTHNTPYQAFDSGGKGFHIHIFFTLPKDELTKEAGQYRITHDNIRLRLFEHLLKIAKLTQAERRWIDSKCVKFKSENKGKLIRAVGGRKFFRGRWFYKSYIRQIAKQYIDEKEKVIFPPKPEVWHLPKDLFKRILQDEIERKKRINIKRISFKGKYTSLPCIQNLLSGLSEPNRNQGAQILAAACYLDRLNREETSTLMQRYARNCSGSSPFSYHEGMAWFDAAKGKLDYFGWCRTLRDFQLCKKNRSCLYERANENKAKKEGTANIVSTSFFQKDGVIYEQVYDKEGGCRFARWDGEKVEYVEKIVDGEITYVPIFDDSIKEGAILLPKKAEAYDSLEKLSASIKRHIHTYLDVSEDYETFATYYILLSWVYDKLNTLPYLRFLGDTGCGKSRALDVIGRLCYKPCIVSGCITPAPIYRMIKRWGGTIILDEADFKDSSEKAEVITILNCGFERCRPVIRCHKDKPDELQFLPTFGPKVFSSRYTFKDVALESRCLTEKMKETSRRDIPAILPQRFYDQEMKIRNQLLTFRFQWRSKIQPQMIQAVELGDVSPRLKQATSSFAVLFASIPPLMERFRKFLQRYNQELIEERATTFEGMVVNVIFSLKGGGLESISSKDIAEEIEKAYGYNHITPQKVGRYLKSLNIQTVNRRVLGTIRRCIQWDRELMCTLRKRYIPYINATNAYNANSEDVASVASPMGQKANATSKKINGDKVNLDAIVRIVEEYDRQNNGNGIPKDTLLSFYTRDLLKPGKINTILKKAIEKLIFDGVLFQPRPGVFKVKAKAGSCSELR